MTQRDQVLRLLRAAGPDGVHSFELAAAVGLRAAARVDELRTAGFVIDSKREKYGRATGCRYRLHDTPAPAVAEVRVTPASDPVADMPLFAGPVPLDRQYGDAA